MLKASHSLPEIPLSIFQQSSLCERCPGTDIETFRAAYYRTHNSTYNPTYYKIENMTYHWIASPLDQGWSGHLSNEVECSGYAMVSSFARTLEVAKHHF
jgi:hypothetical protein